MSNLTSEEAIKASNRALVLMAYNLAVVTNKNLFLKGDEKATEEYIFKNQIEDAYEIVREFKENNRRAISVSKKTKVGMDGLMIEVAKLMTTHPDDDFVVNFENVRIITGMSNAGWEKDMKDKSPECFRDKIFHHGQLRRADLNNLRDALLIFDEIDTGDKEFQVLHRVLDEAGLLDIQQLVANNIRFVFASATMFKELYDLYQWGDLHKEFKMTIPPSYIGHIDFLNLGIIQEFYPIKTVAEAERWIQEDVLDNYGTDYRVHLARVRGSAIFLQNACANKKVIYKDHTSSDRLTPEEINELFKDPLKNHVVLGVKGFFRRANLIPNAWKLRIGATHELHTKVVDYNVQIQGLPGRMTGYWRHIIEGGHKTGPHRTSIQAVKDYELNFMNPYGLTSYRSAGFVKTNGHIAKKPTMISVKNVKGINPSDLPYVAPVEREFEVTCLWDDAVTLRAHLKSIIPVGNITKYTPTADGTIQIRGVTTQIYDYVDHASFQDKDVYSGISKTVRADCIVARIMPVNHGGVRKWVGIYSKVASAAATAAAACANVIVNA